MSNKNISFAIIKEIASENFADKYVIHLNKVTNSFYKDFILKSNKKIKQNTHHSKNLTCV